MKTPKVASKAAARRSLDYNRQQTQPLKRDRSFRRHEISTLTSLPAGKMVPIACLPVLREDAVRSGRIRLQFEMHETAEILMNAVNCTVQAYFVPYLAFDRFDGMDALNKAYKKVAGAPDFIITQVAGAHGSNEILKYLGLHARPGDAINTAPVEAYNAIWNFRAKNRSPNIAERLATDQTLAPAFWRHDRYRHIVPTFDDKMWDGAIDMTYQQDPQTLLTAQDLPVKGIGKYNTGFSGVNRTAFESGDLPPRVYQSYSGSWGSGQDNDRLIVEQDPNNPGRPNIHVAMPQIQVSGGEQTIRLLLSNVELAKKTQAYARLREQYSELDDQHIIDLLMAGISVPEQMWKQPILLSHQHTVFGLSKRYATDAANLTQSVVNGGTMVDMAINLPRNTTGGVIMVVAETVPDQLWERQEDALLSTIDPERFPDAYRDELDMQPVDRVYNGYVDVDHDTPAGLFGYAPMNHKWNITSRRVGGRFFRPEVDAPFDEDRQRIWAAEVQNPTLSQDFYVASVIHTKPFADTTQDPFEVVANGDVVFEGNTVFGPPLIEGSGTYDEVLSQAPQDRIDVQPPA